MVQESFRFASNSESIPASVASQAAADGIAVHTCALPGEGRANVVELGGMVSDGGPETYVGVALHVAFYA